MTFSATTSDHPQTTLTADVIVVGLGAMGSAAFYQFAQRGLNVIGLDRYHPPHDQGSSHGETRITRLSVGEGEIYMPLVRRSHDIWRELEAATGRTLFTQCGLLILEDSEQEVLHHGKPKLLHTTAELARKHGIAHEMLSAAEVTQRFPAFLPPEGTLGYFEPGAGYLNPEACIEAQLEEGVRLGGQIFGGQTVTQLEQLGAEVRLTTQNARYSAPRVVLATGAWLPAQLGAQHAQHIAVYRQVFHWFQATEPQLYTPDHCPAFIWPYGAGAGDYLYGFPSVDPVHTGVKLGTEQHLTRSSAEELQRQIAPEEMAEMWQRHTQPRLRGLSDRQLSTKTCMYSTTPDGDFIIDAHPDISGVTIVSACSGHGFKHSAGVGVLVADMVTGGAAPGASAIPFSLHRFA